MKKRGVIATVLAMSMVLAGTGYAYWTDTLNVTTKATTGDLDVTFADLGLYAQYVQDDLKNGAVEWSIIDGVSEAGYVNSLFFRRGTEFNKIAKDGTIAQYGENTKGYHDVTFDAELVDASPIDVTIRNDYTPANTKGSDNITVDINKIYPGYAQAFRTDILNNGSIAAKLSGINFQVSALGDNVLNDTTKNMLGVALLVEREYQTGNEVSPVFELCKAAGLTADDIFSVGGVDFLRLSALGKIDPAVLQNEQLLAVPSRNSADLYLGVAMDPDAEGKYTTGSTKVLSEKEDSLSQNTGATLSIDLLWDQFNEGKTVDSTNRLSEQNK